jgi:hypothetical protein
MGKTPRVLQAKPEANGRSATRRINLVQVVTTPLNFFVLVVLVVEAIIGSLASFSGSTERPILVLYMTTIIVLLVLIVALLAWFRPEALRGARVASAATPLRSELEISIVSEPSVLVASSVRFNDLSIDKDIEAAKIVGRDKTRIERGIGSKEFCAILLKNKFDILHFVADVEQIGGKIFFTSVDTMPPAGLSDLVKLCGAKLVVLATCDSLSLGAHLSRVTNVVAASTQVEDEAVVAWEQCFYEGLAQGYSLSEAFDVSRSATSAEMVLLLKRDIRFAPSVS